AIDVFRVEHKGKDHVLKLTANNLAWGRQRLGRERDILRMAEGVSGITHLVKDYTKEFDFYTQAILKEYFPGENLSMINKSKISTSAQQKAEEAVRDLHSIGIANLDLKPSDIIISPNGWDSKIVGFGHCSSYSDDNQYVSKREFDRAKQKDLYRLESLFR
ncbi:MAG: serine/threonine-protein kinase, partial [Nanoarchaeota archaeon]|nr:serine/threonine-protein kinase [Nanoarchaeota archaeon]